MPMRLSSLRHALLAASILAPTIAVGAPALAFSRIDPGDGISDSREGIIAVPLPPLPSADLPAGPAPARTSPDGQRRNGAVPAVAPGAEPADSGEPEGTDSEEVPISPEDEDVLRQRREPGRDGTVEDSAPLNPGGNSEDPRAQAPKSQGNQTPEAPTGKPPGSGARGKTPGAVKPFTSGSGSAPSADRGKPTSDALTGDADRGAAVAPAVPLPSQIAYGDDGLPGPVRDLRAMLMEIARTGDIEKLRPYLQGGEDATVLSFGDTPDDPIAFLKDASGDGQGIEMLAILLEVLQAGHAHVEPGDTDEIYVWPYFTQLQIDTLTKPQMVQLFELVTAGDYEAMKAFGAYNFFRIGISPDGKLEFFVAGD